MIARYNCIPFFYPKPPPEFYKSHGISLAKNESIFCSIEELVKMAKNIDKYKAVGNHQTEDLIKGRNALYNFNIHSLNFEYLRTGM